MAGGTVEEIGYVAAHQRRVQRRWVPVGVCFTRCCHSAISLRWQCMLHPPLMLNSACHSKEGTKVRFQANSQKPNNTRLQLE
jgi:hypothetical protein